jgi:hypothetical protein
MICVSGTLPNPMWSSIVRQFGRQLELAADLTVFGGPPGTVTPLPGPLGGDPARLPQLTKTAATATGFLNLLTAKGYFLMLPRRVPNDIRVAGLRFDFSGLFIRESAETDYIGNTVLAIRLASDTPALIAAVGAGLGQSWPEPLSTLNHLAAIYHELCHAWMVEIVAAIETWQALERDGIAHYASARVQSGASVGPRAAYLEAAGDYVGQRVNDWYSTLSLLARMLAEKGTAIPGPLAEMALSAREDYDRRLAVQLYGAVAGSELVSPTLPPSLREALDAEVLDGLPLTRPFAQTPLQELYDAVVS